MDSIKFFFLSIENIILNILEVVFFLIVRLYFDIEVIGQYGVIISFFMMFTFILELGFSTAYLKLIYGVRDSFLTYLFKGYSKDDIKFILTILKLKNIKESIKVFYFF